MKKRLLIWFSCLILLTFGITKTYQEETPKAPDINNTNNNERYLDCPYCKRKVMRGAMTRHVIACERRYNDPYKKICEGCGKKKKKCICHKKNNKPQRKETCPTCGKKKKKCICHKKNKEPRHKKICPTCGNEMKRCMCHKTKTNLNLENTQTCKTCGKKKCICHKKNNKPRPKQKKKTKPAKPILRQAPAAAKAIADRQDERKYVYCKICNRDIKKSRFEKHNAKYHNATEKRAYNNNKATVKAKKPEKKKIKKTRPAPTRCSYCGELPSRCMCK